jgi:hypothetical protein
MLIDEHTVNIIDPATGHHLASNTIDLDRNHWRNTQRDPGRWPKSPRRRQSRDSAVNNHATHDMGGAEGIRTPDPLDANSVWTVSTEAETP